MRDLIPSLEHAAPDDGMTSTVVPFMKLNRRSRPGSPHAHVLRPCVGVFVAGHKRARIGGRDIHLRPGDLLTVARATPTISHIVRAPYLAVMLAVDVELVASL